MKQASRASSPLLRPLLATSLLLLAAGCGVGGGSDGPPLPATSSSIDSSQAPNVAVDTFVQAEMKRQEIPGLALVVEREGKVIYAKGYGYADREKATGATTEQRFQIGSISKQFMAAAVMLLVEDGKMALDDKIGKYLGAVPAQWDGITVRHLLNHSSGFQRDIDTNFEKEVQTHAAYTTDQLLEHYKTYRPEMTPGTVYGYSNVGYQLMGLIVEKVTGAFYGDLIQNRIFTPLGMTSARIIDFNNFSGNATGYYVDGKNLVPQRMEKLSGGAQSIVRMAAGGIEMSATDLGKWDASLYTEKPLKKSSIDQMWAPSILVEKGADYTINYGLGWMLSDYKGHPKVYHSGGMRSFSSDYLRFTTDKVSVIALINVVSSTADPQTISRGVGNIYVPGSWPPK
ncbi:MAG: serine hydrolase domain-containing protein [Pseudomonadota bacterium]